MNVSRKRGKADLTYDQINQYVLNACNLIVNTTPLGTWPDIDEAPEFPYQFLTTNHLVYDLVYNPDKSLFLKQAETAGATIMNGLKV